ncbi:MAG: ABC transporter substrate-binding protein [Clostridiales bacterium]|nr:ABC transporter substrate-binding protein [Clostridiales bacterium]
MKKLFTLLLALAVVLSMSAVSAMAEAEYDPAATLYLVSTADPVTCDPALASDGQSGMVIDRVFASLVRYTQDGGVTPELAESYEITEDGTVYTFKIREGITFHDGTVCDANAILWNFERQMGDNATADMPYAESCFGNIVKAEAPDPLTFVVTLAEPSSSFLMNCAMRIAMGIVSPTAWEADPEGFARNPVGAGPYKFGEWVSGQYVTMPANEDYILGAPTNAMVVVRFIPESATRTSEMLSGGIDIMGDIALDDIAVLKAADNVKVIATPGTNIGYLAFADYEKNELFSDIRLRQAIAHALDMDAINAGLYGEDMVTAKSILPPTMIGGDGEFSLPEYNPEKAKELMAEAGYPDGFSFTLLTYNVSKGYNPAGERLAVQVQAELAKVGIDCKIVIEPWSEFITSMYAETPDYDAIVAGWGAAANDAAYMLQLLESVNAGVGCNHSGYSNPEYDALVNKGRKAASFEEAAAYYAQAAQLANEDLPVIPMGHGTGYSAASIKIINADEVVGGWGVNNDYTLKAK